VPIRRLREDLDSGKFVTTVEYNPPKGTDVSTLLENAKALVGKVQGVNVTDNTAAILRAGSMSICRLLHEMGHDPVMQVTCRDRNRLAIQSDLMSAHILGIRNILCLTGDYPTVGDHKDAKPVYDLDSIGVMQVIGGLNQGKDMAGHKLSGVTDLYVGAAVTPEMDPQGPMLAKFAAKVNAGTRFFQTQAFYDTDRFKSFMGTVRKFPVKVLAGILVLRSAKMAEFMNTNIPGIDVPSHLIEELRAAGEEKALDVGVQIAVRMIKAVRDHCDGVHIMAVKAVDRLPEILQKAELA
jgi:methylenetetrahydrofolate reductase (NADPH)